MKYIVIAFLVLIGGSFSGYYLLNNRIEDIKNGSATTSQLPEEKKIQAYSMEDIVKHSTPQDCWFAVSGEVYDVTQYIKDQKHPGKDAITKGCGKDASELYATKAGKGEDHSDKAKGFLENFKIGTFQMEATPSGM